jgi:hypothetical protein
MVIQELLIALGYKFDPKPLEDAEKKGVEGAEKTEGAWKQTALSVGAGIASIGAAAVGAAASMFKLVDSSTKAGDEVAKGARAAGMASGEFQRMKFAADRGGASLQTLQTGARTLNTQLDRARQGATSAFTDSLKRLGLTTDDLAESAEENFARLADALKTIEDPQERAALRAELFGQRAGPQLASMLDEGGDSIRELGQEAERLGLVMSEDALDASEAFQDSVTNMKGAVGALARDIGIDLAPTIQDVTDDITSWITENGELIRQDLGAVAQGLADGLRGALPLIKDTISAMVTLTDTARGLFLLIEDFTGETENRRRADRADAKVRQEMGEMSVEALRNMELMTDHEFKSDDSGGALGALNAAKTRSIRRGLGKAAAAELDRRAGPFEEPGEMGPELPAGLGAGGGRGGGRRGANRGRGADRGVHEDMTVGEFEFEALDMFGQDIEATARQLGATDEQVNEAVRAGARALEGHASPAVALKAAISKLQSLTGNRGGGPMDHDPVLSEIFGEDMPVGVPPIRLSEMTGRNEPNVLVNTNNITNTVDVQIMVDGSEDPSVTGRAVLDELNSHLADIFTGAGRLNGPTLEG